MSIEGTVNNGRECQVEFGSIKCNAGVRDVEGGVHVAFVGKPPLKLPINGTIDGQTFQAISAWKSGLTAGMAVMLAVPRSSD